MGSQRLRVSRTILRDHSRPGHDRDRTHGEVDRGRHEKRALNAQPGDQPQTSQQRSDDRAEGVRAVKNGHALADPGCPKGGRLDDKRKRGPHQSGGDDQHAEGNRKPDKRERAQRVGQRWVQIDVHLLQPVERHRSGQCRRSDEDLAHAEPHEGPSYAVAHAARDEASYCEASHETRPDRARRVGRHAEDEAQEPQPDDLVDERTDARTKEEDEERRLNLSIPN